MLINLITAFLLRISLDISNYFVSEVFTIFSFTIDLNRIKLIESYLLLTIVIILMPNKKNNISSLIVWLFIILTYIPTLTIFGLGNEDRYWTYATTCFWLLLFFILRIKYQKIAITKYVIKNSKSTRNILYIIIIIYTFLCIATRPNLSFTINLTDIYDLRKDFKPILPFAAYVITWTAFVINPSLMIIFSYQKKYVFTILISILQFLMFAATGQKIILLSIPLILAINFLKEKRMLTFSSISIFLTILISLGFMSFIIWKNIWISAIFTNRLLILPAIISFYYYNFFSQNDPIYLGHSLLSFLGHYPYDILPWYIIGKYYFSSQAMSANTGMLADAYMNFREIGLISLTFIFGIILRFIDDFTKKHDSKLVTACVLMPLLWSINGSFFSSILTGGLGLSILILFTLPSKKQMNNIF